MGTPTDRWRRRWNKQAGSYDRQMERWDRLLFGDSREWACSRATGDVLEVAVGTGLNLPAYPDDVRLTGIDISQEMLDRARVRAEELGRKVALEYADAHNLPFPDDSFDTVVCTFGLCAIPDHATAVVEMTRVLRPEGRLILVDHVASTSLPLRALQKLMELATVPLAGEHFLRRPHDQVVAAGLHLEDADRFKLGVVERLTARKPATT